MLNRALKSFPVVVVVGLSSCFALGAAPSTSSGARLLPGPATNFTPAVLAAYTDPPAVGPYGGTVTVHAQVRDSWSCQLQLLSQQSFPVLFASNIRRCEQPFHTINNYKADIVIGANTTAVRRTLVFKLVVWYGPRRFAHGLFYISVAPGKGWATGTTTTTTPYASVPPGPSSSPSSPQPSRAPTSVRRPALGPPEAGTAVDVGTGNWAGYGVEGPSPYTGVQGTFTVPSLLSTDSPTDVTSIWVGIDGLQGASNPNLIQAGVMESMVACNGLTTYPGTYDGQHFWICPWALTIQGGQPADEPVPALQVNQGDRLKVAVATIGGSYWDISMTDYTTAQTWASGPLSYSGPRSSAEWVVEDPGDVNTPCGGSGPEGRGQCDLAEYDPAISFSDLSLAPQAVSGWQRCLLTTPTAYLVPSPVNFAPSGVSFSVSYSPSF